VNDWPEWPVARLSDLDDPDARGFQVGGGDWPFRGFVVRKGGALRAYANVCPHARHALDFPQDRFLAPDGELLRCASHGALFDPMSGACVFGPCAGRALIPLALRLVDDEIRVMAPASLEQLPMSFPSVADKA
jgi:nitrite reductase/ring-hydroxylating ferredoxin subunit